MIRLHFIFLKDILDFKNKIIKCALEVCTGQFFKPGPRTNLFLSCRLDPLEKLPFICQPRLACWKNHLSIAGPAYWKNRRLGRVWASRQAQVHANLYHNLLILFMKSLNYNAIIYSKYIFAQLNYSC